MKKVLFMAFTAVLALVACNREPVTPELARGVDVIIKGRVAETKTHIVATGSGDATTYTSHWDASGESLGVLFYQSSITASDVPTELPGEASGDEMNFHGTIPSLADGTYKVFLFSPYSAYDSMGDGYLVGTLKTNQSPIAGSFDPACDIMGYSTDNVEIAAGSAVVENVTLQRPFAILRINLNADSNGQAAGQKVTSLKMENSMMPLTGTFKITSTGNADIISTEDYVAASMAASEGITIGGTNNAVYVVVLPISIPVGTELTFTIETEDYSGDDAIVRTVTAPSAMAFQAGKVNVIDLKIRDKDLPAPARYAGGTGVEGDPWLIATAQQMVYMNEDLVSGETKYFKLIDDIDMTGITNWQAANAVAVDGKFDKGIYFDGNGHTISGFTCSANAYPSLFGVLYGTAKDFTVDSPTINAGSNNAGVIAGYIGATYKPTEGNPVPYPGHCSGITVKNATVTGAATSKSRNTGGFAGVVDAEGTTISDCHVTGTTTIKQTSTQNQCSTAGFIGNVNVAITITGCTAKADITNEGSYYTGGFIGQIGSAVAATISSCAYLGGSISAGRNAATNSPVAGFIGRVVSAGAHFTNCYVDGAAISAVNSGRVAGFVGDSNTTNVYTSCYVKNSSIKGSQHSGGFAGVFYCSASKCHVESTTITAGNANTGGFVGYPQNATITNCYVADDVTVSGGSYNAAGGFIGLCKDKNTVSACYEAAGVSGTGTGVGAFIGYIDVATTSITKCVAWDSALSFIGAVKDGVSVDTITNNYTGTSGTISSQAQTLGWDNSVWDFSGSMPTLK